MNIQNKLSSLNWRFILESMGCFTLIFYLFIPHYFHFSALPHLYQPFLTNLLVIFAVILSIKCTILKKIQLKKADLAIIGYAFYSMCFALGDECPSTAYIKTIITLTAFYCFIRTTPVKIIGNLFWIFIITGIYRACFSLQIMDHSPATSLHEISGGFINTGHWALFLALLTTWYFAKILFASSKLSPVKTLLYITTGGLLSLSIYHTDSRAAWISALSGILVIMFHHKRYSTKFLAIGISILVLLTCGLYFYKQDSADGRLLIYKSTIPMVAERPLTGFGFEGFSKEYMIRQAVHLENQTDTDYINKADETLFAFNELLKLQVERGLVGVIFTIGLLGFILSRSSIKKHLFQIFILRGMFACFCTFCMFSYPLSDFTLQTFGVFLLADIVSCSKNDLKEVALNRKMSITLAISILSIGISLFPYFHHHETAFRKWHLALNKYEHHSSDALYTLASIHPNLNYDPTFLYTYGRLLNHSGKHEEAICVLQESYKRRASYTTLMEMGKGYADLQQYEEAEKCWNSAGQMIPNRFLPGLLTANMYAHKGDKAKAAEIARKTLTKPIKINSLEVRLIIRQLKKHSQTTENNQ